jgi:hypothetical protein
MSGILGLHFLDAEGGISSHLAVVYMSAVLMTVFLGVQMVFFLVKCSRAKAQSRLRSEVDEVSWLDGPQS